MLSRSIALFRLSHINQSQKLSAILVIFAAPLCLLLSALSPYCTAAVFAIATITLIYLRYKLFHSKLRDRDKNKSHYFIVWLCSSIIFLMIIFHTLVIEYLEILPEENLILVILATGSVACLYNAKQKGHQLVQTVYTDDVERISDDKQVLISKFIFNIRKNTLLFVSWFTFSSSSNYCIFCQSNIPKDYRHSLWLDCCIGADNNKFFVVGVFLGMAALFYGSNLTFTTICHPFILYKTILLPDDCSYVYYEYKTAVCFVCGLYSLLIAVLMLWFFIKKCLSWLVHLSERNLKNGTFCGCWNRCFIFDM